MVFLIQNTQNRDGAAIQAKLDELLRAVKGAREQFIGIEHLTDSELELIREALERESGTSQNQKRAPKGTVDRLLGRR
jgi:low affinity Fe/Cu permease